MLEVMMMVIMMVWLVWSVWVGYCVSACVMTTPLRQKNVGLNGSSREGRMEGYKFSTNWLQSETQKPADDRQATPRAEGSGAGIFAFFLIPFS